jgi:glycosyltransferase domain-containing protein
MPAPTPRSRYTLLIPTYNRSTHLRSLLGYLAARRFGNPIRVLDSSENEALSANRESVERSGLDIRHQIYDSSTDPYAKFALGADSVDTPYCSFCADDDIPFTDNWPRLLDFLDANPAFVAAHGLYINVKPDDPFHISYMVYDGPSIEGDDGLRRLDKQMGAYQAVFYAIYRTEVLRTALQGAQRMTTLLAQELLASSLTMVHGNVHRMPEPYLARNTKPSIATGGWHPHQMLATEPAALFRQYTAYRDILLEHLVADARCRATYAPEQMQRIVDLAHLKYLAPMLSRPIMDYLIEQSMRPDMMSRQIIEGVWRTFVPPDDRGADGWRRRLAQMRALVFEPNYASESFEYVRRLTRLYRTLRFGEKFVISPGSLFDRMTVERSTRDGRARRYAISPTLVSQDFANGGHVTASQLRNMIGHFDDYV